MKTIERFRFVLLFLLLATLGATVSLTTVVTIDSGAGTDAVISESGIDRASASAETFNIQNSGAGAMTLQVDGTSVPTTAGYAGTGQISTTLNPASTAFTDGAIIANPAACNTNEILVGAGVGGVGKATMDCEGDLVATKGDFSGAITANAGATFQTGGIVNMSVNLDMRAVMVNLGTASCAGSSEGPAGAVCVNDVFAINQGGAVATAHMYTVIATNQSSQWNIYAAGIGSEEYVMNTGLPSTAVAVGGVGYATATSAISNSNLQDQVFLRAIGKLTTFASSLASAAGTAGWKFMAAAAGTKVDVFTIDTVGNFFLNAAATRSKGECTLDGASPSKCTATVAAGSECTCSPVGTTAVIAAGGCAVSISSTTATFTSANGLTNNVSYHCF